MQTGIKRLEASFDGFETQMIASYRAEANRVLRWWFGCLIGMTVTLGVVIAGVAALT